MAVAKKATKKTTKKVVKKAPAKKKAVAKKIDPKKAAAEAAKAQRAILLRAARVVHTHDLVQRNELRVGDRFLVNDSWNGPSIGVPNDWESSLAGEAVIFRGINDEGLLVVSLEGTYFRLPVEAVDFSEITEASDLDQEEEVVLNNSYTARVEQGYTEVAVGCQRIHIDRVREVIAAYDRVQGDGPVAQNRETTLTADGTYAELLYVAK